MRPILKLIAGIALAALLLTWVLRDVDARGVGRVLTSASIPLAAASAVLNLGQNAFRVWRWQVLLAPVRARIPFRPMFAAILIGYMTSWVVPGRLGEVVRPLLLASRENLPVAPCVGSVVADRLLDGATIVGLFALGTWIAPPAGPAAEHAALMRGGSLAVAMAVAAGLAVLLVLAAAGPAIGVWASGRGRVLRWVARSAVSVSHGVHALRSPLLTARIVLHSLAIWLLIAASTWAGVAAVGADVSFGAMLVVMPMLALGVAVPTPGGAGSYHGAMRIGLTLYGVAEPVAVAAALLVHLLITIPIIGIGAALLWTEKLTWRDLLATARTRRTDLPAEDAR